VGYISGASVGVFIGGGTGTVTNAGTIHGGSGVVIASGGVATVSNAGTIAGTSGTAVALGGGSNRLILSPGASFQGTVDGGGGSSVLEVAASAATAGLSQAAAIAVPLGSIKNFSAAQIDPTADADASGNLSFDTLSNQGTVNLLAGAVVSFGTVISAVSGGTIDIQAGGTVHFKGAVA